EIAFVVRHSSFVGSKATHDIHLDPDARLAGIDTGTGHHLHRVAAATEAFAGELREYGSPEGDRRRFGACDARPKHPPPHTAVALFGGSHGPAGISGAARNFGQPTPAGRHGHSRV